MANNVCLHEMIYLIIIYYLYSKAVTESRDILFAVGYQHGFAFPIDL